MKAEDFVELVLKLNDSLDNKFIENLGLCFSYHTNYYYDQILFGEFPVYCSESDTLHDFEINKEITVKEVVIKNFNEYAKALNTIKL